MSTVERQISPADGADHMGGGEHIGIGIDPVKQGEQRGEDRGLFHLCGTQVLTAGNQKPYRCTEKKRQRQELHIPAEGSAVPYQEKKACSD